MSAKGGAAIFSIVGMILSGLVGYAVGKSKAQERIHSLQREILRLQEVSRQRNQATTQLEERVAQIDAEFAAMGHQRAAFGDFIKWIATAHPDVIERYRVLEQAEREIALLQSLTRQERDGARRQVEALSRKHPEAAGLLLEHRDYFS